MGALGTGVYIVGAARILKVGNVSFSHNTGTLGQGVTYDNTMNTQIVTSTVTVPTGKRWVGILAVSTLDLQGALRLISYEAIFMGGANEYSLPAGTYDGLAITSRIAGETRYAVSNIALTMRVDYAVIEVDDASYI